VEARYNTHDQELLAIVKGFEEYRYFLIGGEGPVEVLTDYNNLRYFIITKKLTGR
jgi:RNase H-like domain found in reverse transcriptase